MNILKVWEGCGENTMLLYNQGLEKHQRTIPTNTLGLKGQGRGQLPELGETEISMTGSPVRSYTL
jgi:hypothetical protein